MPTLSERQYCPVAALWCGECDRTYPVPDVRRADGVGGAVTCDECGHPVAVIGIVRYGEANWATLDYEARRAGHLLADARLHPLSLMQALAAAPAEEPPR